jgi:hypothetical protein
MYKKMKKISLICFSIGVMLLINSGCISVMTILSKGELQKTGETETGYRCGQPLAPAIAGDMIIAYSSTWDRDENSTRNLYQNAPASLGFMLIDALAGNAIYKLFYKDAKPPIKEETPKSQH